MQLINKILILQFVFFISLNASSCSEYFNPENFHESPEYLQDLLDNKKELISNQEFDIEKKEIYRPVQQKYLV